MTNHYDAGQLEAQHFRYLAYGLGVDLADQLHADPAADWRYRLDQLSQLTAAVFRRSGPDETAVVMRCFKRGHELAERIAGKQPMPDDEFIHWATAALTHELQDKAAADQVEDTLTQFMLRGRSLSERVPGTPIPH